MGSVKMNTRNHSNAEFCSHRSKYKKGSVTRVLPFSLLAFFKKSKKLQNANPLIYFHKIKEQWDTVHKKVPYIYRELHSITSELVKITEHKEVFSSNQRKKLDDYA